MEVIINLLLANFLFKFLSRKEWVIIKILKMELLRKYPKKLLKKMIKRMVKRMVNRMVKKMIKKVIKKMMKIMIADFVIKL
jgi:uncharacterized protein YaaW (UPF0174 family)